MLSIVEQCELLSLNRSTLYYPVREVDPFNLKLMSLIDEVHTEIPFYGYRKITDWLNKQGNEVNHKRVQRLMALMQIEALYPRKKPNLSAPGHRIFPYLLRDLEIVRPNQVWGVDITYIRMRHGFLYLVAIIDWFSRYVLAWELSNSLVPRPESFFIRDAQIWSRLAVPGLSETAAIAALLRGLREGGDGQDGPKLRGKDEKTFRSRY